MEFIGNATADFERFKLFNLEQNRIERCPNCGGVYKSFELNNTSTKRIDVPKGSIVSTLYGVCKKCADNHSR